MKIQFNVSSKINKEETIEKTKLVLFDSMMKMHELATNNVPVDTGLLKITIKLFPSVSGAKKYVLADGVTYGIHVEFGTDPHIIKVKNKKVFSIVSSLLILLLTLNCIFILLN